VRSIKLVAALSACIAVALVIQRELVPRYACNAEKKRTELWLDTARESGSPERQLAVARAAIPRLTRCAEFDPGDYEALFLLGVARYDAGQKEAALNAYAASLAVNERPETYTNIGSIQLEQGKLDAARQNLFRAMHFHANVVIHFDPLMRHELQTEFDARQARLKKRVREPSTSR
jgi:tetratricopeptide (TPR) repeat protein